MNNRAIEGKKIPHYQSEYKVWNEKKTSKMKWIIGWPKKKSPVEKDFGQKKAYIRKKMKWRIEQLRQKKSPDTEVNDRMDKRKKSPIEKEKYDEVKNRADGRTDERTEKKNPPVYK